MGILSGVFGKRIPTIIAPRAAVLDLPGAPAAELLKEDKQFLNPIFGDITVSISRPPACDVLFVYCSIGPDGVVHGTRSGLWPVSRQPTARQIW